MRPAITIVAMFGMALLAAAIFGCGHGEGKKDGNGGEGAVKAAFLMEPIVVNLADEEDRYLRVTLGLDITDQKEMETVKGSVPMMRDAVLTLLSSKHYDDLRSPDGKAKLKGELMRTLNAALKKNIVVNVYYSDFVAQ
jgi:flagellar basal body-associated protein FliL